MKVYIGPYRDWIGPYQIADMIFFWVEKYPEDESIEARWDYRLHDLFGDWLAKTWVKDLCQWIEDKRERKVKVKIDYYDTWSMDNTLAYIIIPMLKQLRDTKHGSPYVEEEDVPTHLQMTKREKKLFEEGHWNKKIKATEDEKEQANAKFHDRWSWVLDEMIFAFESQFNNWEDQFRKGTIEFKHTPVDKDGNEVPKEEAQFFRLDRGPNDTSETDWDGRKAYGERIQNGYRLFGKYYQSLWD